MKKVFGLVTILALFVNSISRADEQEERSKCLGTSGLSIGVDTPTAGELTSVAAKGESDPLTPALTAPVDHSSSDSE